jgi:NitT/TauT family transport system substrate-binding protein
MFQPSQSVRRSRARSGIALGLAAAAVAVTASACSGGSGGLGSPDDANLRVGVIDSIGAVPFDIGTSTSNHSFMDAGLTITVQTYTSQADELTALAANKIDVAYGEYAQFLNSSSQMADSDNLRVVSEGYDATSGTIGLLTRKGETLPTWGPGNQINCDGGTTIAVPSKKGTEYLALASWLQSLGSPLPANCAAVHEVANPAQAITEVATGQVSAAALQEPYVTAGQITAGLQLTQDLATGNAEAVPVDGYFATKDFTTKYPRTTAIFAAVMAKLQATAGSRVVVETVLGGTKTLDPRVISAMQLGTYPSVVLPARLNIVLGLMGNAGTINGQIDSAKLTDLNSGTTG